MSRLIRTSGVSPTRSRIDSAYCIAARIPCRGLPADAFSARRSSASASACACRAGASWRRWAAGDRSDGPLVQGERDADAPAAARPMTRARAAGCRAGDAGQVLPDDRLEDLEAEASVAGTARGSRPGRSARSGRRSGARSRRARTRTGARSRVASAARSRGTGTGRRRRRVRPPAAARWPSTAARPPPGQIGITPPIRRTSQRRQRERKIAGPSPKKTSRGSIGRTSATTNGSTQVRCGRPAAIQPPAGRPSDVRGSRSRPTTSVRKPNAERPIRWIAARTRRYVRDARAVGAPDEPDAGNVASAIPVEATGPQQQPGQPLAQPPRVLGRIDGPRVERLDDRPEDAPPARRSSGAPGRAPRASPRPGAARRRAGRRGPGPRWPAGPARPSGGRGRAPRCRPSPAARSARRCAAR